ncbi:guanylate cyclase [Streptomyces cellostaticus]|nr:guanylate cyclase [Streptomyces cellostaticus]
MAGKRVGQSQRRDAEVGRRCDAMPQFMDIHHGMKDITTDQLREAYQDNVAIEGEEGVHFERAWADPESGTVYCLSEAPSAEAVKRIHERTGHPADEIHPVPLTV